MIFDKKNREIIEMYLIRYKEIKLQLEEEREEILYSSGSIDLGGGGKSNLKSDETSLKALKLYNLSRKREETWCNCIEDTIKHFDKTIIADVIRLRYFEREKMINICKLLHIEKTTLYNYRETVIVYLGVLATNEDLIKINNKR